MVMFGWLRQKSNLNRAWLGLLVLFILALIFTLYFWRLGTLTKGLSPAETAARQSSLSLKTIVDSPIYGPHKLLQYAFQKISGHGALQLRLTSVFFGLFFLVCFYLLVKNWFGRMIGLFAALFLAATPWFVLLSRDATPQILLLLPLSVIGFYYWLVRSKSSIAWLALAMSSAALIYLPGGPYLLLIGLVAARKNLLPAIGQLRIWPKVIGALAPAVILAPLIYAVAKNPALLKPLVLVPAQWPGILTFLKSIAWGGLSFFWRLPLHLDTTIGKLPILNGAQVVLALFGGFALLRLARQKLFVLLGLAASALLFSAITQDYLLLPLALPTVAVLGAAGLRYLYLQWRGVFPKNPLPNYLALGLISLLLGLHILYGIRYALHAWPNTPATRATYVLK